MIKEIVILVETANNKKRKNKSIIETKYRTSFKSNVVVTIACPVVNNSGIGFVFGNLFAEKVGYCRISYSL